MDLTSEEKEETGAQTIWMLLGATILVGLVGFLSVYPIHLPISYYDSDFLDYCIGIEALDDIKLRTPSKRSNLAAMLPYLASKMLGVINGLAFSSILCTLLLIAISLRWTQELRSGPLTLWTTAIITVAMGPVMSLLRIINFYPQVVLATFLGAWWVDRALRKPTIINLFLAGCSVPLVMMIDVRGLIWGLWFALLLIGICGLGLWKRRWWTLPAIGLPLWLGWPLGRWAYHRLHSPLSRQLDIRPLYNKVDPGNPLYQPPHSQPDGFLWGRSTFGDLWEELVFLVEQAQLPTPQAFYQFSSVSSSVQSYWTVCFVLLLLSLGWLGWRRNKNSLQAALVLVPFFVSFWKLPDVVEPHIRFYAQCLPGLLVVIAVATSDVLEHFRRRVQAGILVGVLAVSILAVPYWGVSRVMLNAHVEMALPEAKEINQLNGLIRGYEVHLYVSPITKQESLLQANWIQICNERLAQDGVIVPFYQPMRSQ